MSDLNLTINEDSDIYLAITETPAVVSISSPLIASANVSVTVGTSVTVANFPAVTTVAGTVTAKLDYNNFNGALTNYVEDVSSHNGFPVEIAYQPSVTIGSLPAISGTVTANDPSLITRSAIVADTGKFIRPVAGRVSGGGISSSYEPIKVDENGVVAISGTVSLDSASLVALENITVTVGSSVSVSNLPAATTPNDWETIGDQIGAGLNAAGLNVDVASLPAISGTVTANFTAGNSPINSIHAYITNAFDDSVIASDNPLPISGTVTANVFGWDTGNQENLKVGVYSVGDRGVLEVIGADGYPVQVSGTVTVGNVEGWGIPLHDYRSFSYSDGNLSTIAYKTGGASGTTVGILTLAYDGSGNLTSMTKS